MIDFDIGSLEYATIIFGDRVIKGECTYWSLFENHTIMSLVVNGKEYLTSVNNVLLEEIPTYMRREPVGECELVHGKRPKTCKNEYTSLYLDVVRRLMECNYRASVKEEIRKEITVNASNDYYEAVMNVLKTEPLEYAALDRIKQLTESFGYNH